MLRSWSGYARSRPCSGPRAQHQPAPSQADAHQPRPSPWLSLTPATLPGVSGGCRLWCPTYPPQRGGFAEGGGGVQRPSGQ
jgi:hypothetical protein